MNLIWAQAPGASGYVVERQTGGGAFSQVQTIVNWNDGSLVDYFRSNGFERGEYVNLVKEI